MANVKATDTVIIREMFKGKENDLQTMTSSLKPEILKTFQTAMSVSWIPLEFESEIIQAAARLLCPKDPRPIFKLGHTVAGKQFTGVYKFFLRIPSVSFIVKNASASFNTMNDKGSARVDDVSSKGGTLVISDLPEMSIVQREYICGVVTCVLELAGAKNIKVEKIETNPNEWKWKITWD
jgi:uncharacterized protein (TIGR02265 family)